MDKPTDIINDIHITGPTSLSGEVTTNSAKNSTVALIAASLLNKGTTTLHNVSRIADVFRLLEIVELLGVKINWIKDNSITIKVPEQLSIDNLDKEAVKKGGRSTLLLLGALIHKLDQFSWPHGGGCKMGERSIVAHKHGLEQFGLSIRTAEDDYQVNTTNLASADITLYEASDTATENLILASSLIPGKTTIRFAQANYMVQEVCFFLQDCGIKIEGIGTRTLTIEGEREIDIDINYTVAEDPIESMMFIASALTTRSELTIRRCPLDFLRLELLRLEEMGAEFKISESYQSYNGRTELVDIQMLKSDLSAPVEKIHALPYPGINSDNLPFFVPIATQAEGTTLIHDWMWENRAIYFTELNRLGADIRLADPHRVFIDGPTDLKAARIVCPPALRPSMTILVAMLAADGESVLHSVYPINRGYENIFERLNQIGARINVIS